MKNFYEGIPDAPSSNSKTQNIDMIVHIYKNFKVRLYGSYTKSAIDRVRIGIGTPTTSKLLEDNPNLCGTFDQTFNAVPVQKILSEDIIKDPIVSHIWTTYWYSERITFGMELDGDIE